MAGFRTAALAVVLFIGLAAQSAVAQGALVGRVTNSATGKPLEGARVELKGTTRATDVDETGEYRFTDVAPGTVTVSVSYTGLNTAEETVTVASGAPTRRDVGLTADIYRLSKFVVSGEREGNAQAITLQKQSSGVKNIVSTDAFGSLAGNPADLLKLLPGIEAESVGGDRRYIKVRGMSSDHTAITMDGSRMGSGGGASGGGRSYEFNPQGSDTIERVEVVKSPTPDMAADSMGGAVNFVSKNAFNHGLERRISGSMGAIDRPTDPRDKIRRNFSISYSEVFNEKLGVSFNYAKRQHGTIIDIGGYGYSNVPNGSTDPRYITSFGPNDFRNIRTGWGGGLRVDYKLNEHSRFYVNSIMNKYREYANHHSASYSTSATLGAFDANGKLTGPGAVLPGFSNRMVEWGQLDYINAGGTRVAPNTLGVTSSTEYRRDQTFNTQIAGIHRYDQLEIDWSANRAKSKAHYPGNKTFTVSTRGFGLKIEQKNQPFFPTITQTAGPDTGNISSYDTNLYNVLIRSGWDDMKGASVDVKKSFTTPVPSYIKAGYRVREQLRNVAVESFRANYVGPDGVMGRNPATGINDDNLGQFTDTSYKYPDTRLAKFPRLPYAMVPGRDTPGSTFGNTGFNVETALKANPGLFRQDIAFNTTEQLAGENYFSEKISAPYIMGAVDIGKLNIMAGVRLETTEVMGNGALQQLDAVEKARRAAWVGPLTYAESERRVRAEYKGRQIVNAEYSGVFPGIHFKYEPFRNMIARLSYASNIGRPSIGQLIPRTTVNLPGIASEAAVGSIVTSNPNLKPQRAENFDLTLEYYFEPAGLLSGGIFLKEIRSFIFTSTGNTVGAGANNGYDGQYVGYLLSTQMNGGFAKIKGLELNYIQQFTFLPGWWSGLGAYANYTRLSVVGNYAGGGVTAVAPTSEVAGFNPETGNLGISYIRNKITLRVQYNHHGRFLTSFSTLQSGLQYARARDVIDIKTGYQISKNYSVYLDVVNVFKEPDRASESYDGAPRAIHQMGPMVLFGINARL